MKDFLFFYSLYTEMPDENIKQIILQVWNEEGKDNTEKEN